MMTGMMQTPTQTMAKMSASIAMGTLVTLAAFAFMDYLISSEERATFTTKPVVVVEIAQNREDSDTKEMTRKLPPPPEPKAQPPRPEPQTSTETIGLSVETFGPSMEFTSPPINSTLSSQGDGGAMPIVRVDPKYPTEAARDGKEGWVELAFSIDKAGNVFDAKVVNAEPKRLFNRSALKAIKRWKYRPKIENGQPVVQSGLQVMLEFNLQQ